MGFAASLWWEERFGHVPLWAPFPSWQIVKRSELGRLLFVWCMGILVALVHQATFQTLSARGHGGGGCVSPNGFRGSRREQASAHIGLIGGLVFHARLDFSGRSVRRQKITGLCIYCAGRKNMLVIMGMF